MVGCGGLRKSYPRNGPEPWELRSHVFPLLQGKAGGDPKDQRWTCFVIKGRSGPTETKGKARVVVLVSSSITGTAREMGQD